MASEPQKAPRREEVPPLIDGYEMLGAIGRGSSGTVFRARSLAVDREVAIKILHAHLTGESRLVRRLQREARTTARLAHPHIVSAVDMGENGGRWWYAMEFVDGPSLAQRLRNEGRIREREALRLFIPLCEALEHLFEHGVVHRDVKPANILIDRASGARLADLGLAFAEDDPSITGTGGTLGTPHYISPEQAIDPRKADVRSDIWSFGATLFHAVCGRPPFAGESAAEVLSAVLYARIPDPQELEATLSKRLALVLRKCLTRAPEKRYQNPHELLLDLERVRERRAPKVRRSALDPVARQPVQVRRAVLVAGSVLVAGLTLVLALLPRLLREEPEPGALVAGAGGPFVQLEDLAARRARAQGTPAELLAEAVGLEPLVPAHERARYQELVRALDADLRKTARAVQGELETEFEQAIADGDQDKAWRLFHGPLEERFRRRTGYDLAALAQAGVNLSPWRERLELELDGALETGLSELEAALLDWRSERLATEEARLAQQDWEGALEALRFVDADEVLTEAGFRVRLPPASTAGLFEDLAREFGLRMERVQDQWTEVDRGIAEFVVTRRTTLERTLRESRPRIAAADMLRADFERELFERRLTRDKMPVGLARAGLEELEASAHTLLELEESLLEEDARADFAEVDELSADALRRREYERARGLWQDERMRLAATPRCAESAARGELLRRMDVRIDEARLLEQLMARVSERVWELDGQTVDLRYNSITYSNVRIRSGADPLHQGFFVDRINVPIELVRLPSLQIEAFAGFGEENGLAPDERLTLALLRFHDGRALDAQRVLFSGPLPSGAPRSQIGPDLADRIARALEREQQESGAREQEARRLYDGIRDPAFQEHSARIAVLRIGRLLDEFGDVPLVREQRSELVRLRTRLEERVRPRDQGEFERVFQPTRVEPSALGRVTLYYEFKDNRLGAWEAGDWTHDGLGLVLGARFPVASFADLAAERGLRLALQEPLNPDSLEVTLRFEALQGDQPASYLWLSVVGFQVALGAPEPGASGASAEPRFLVGTDEADTFLQRFAGGEGKRAQSLLVPGGPPRELRFKAARRSGRCELYLDGALLERTSGLKAPPSDARALSVRSWGAVRLLSVVIEGQR